MIQRFAFSPQAARHFGRQLVTFDRGKMEPWVALRNTLGIALILLASALIDQPGAGLMIGLGALVVSYSDGSDAYGSRGSRMVASSLLSALAVFMASASAHLTWLASILAVGGAFLAGYSIVLGATIGDIFAISLVMFLVFTAQPASLEKAGTLALFTLVGGSLQALLSVMFWPLHRYNPERRALRLLLTELSRLARTPVKTVELPLASVQSTRTHEALRLLARDAGPDAQRYRSILNQAERVRLGVIFLARLRRRFERNGLPKTAAEIETFLARLAPVLTGLSEGLAQNRAVQSWARERLASQFGGLEICLDGFLNVTEQDGEASAWTGSISGSLKQMRSLIGQTRSIADLLMESSRRGRSLSAPVMATNQPSVLRRVRDAWALSRGVLVANFNLRSTGLRHAVRLAACIATGELIGAALPFKRSYWIPMTIAIALRPEYRATISRSLMRILGTVIGLVVATLVFHFFALSPAIEIVLIGLFMFLTRWLGAANYAIFALSTSGLVVLLIAYTGVAPSEVILARGVNTAVGGMIALFGYLVWPTWEKNQVAETLARVLDSYRIYFDALIRRFWSADGASTLSEEEIENLRVRSRVARSGYHASMERFRDEPGSIGEQIELLAGIWASSNRVAHALMAFDTSLADGTFQEFSAHDRDLRSQFAKAAIGRLETLAHQLRDRSAVAVRVDLTELYFNLAQGGNASADALVVDETLRLANSLNTLEEQVRRWNQLQSLGATRGADQSAPSVKN